MSAAADLVLYNASVITLSREQPRAQAVAVKDGLIAAVGSDDDAAAWSAARRIDCEGKTLIPGFHDAHCHLFALASSLLAVDCSAARSIADIQARIRDRAHLLPQGDWIKATGYHEFDLAEKRHPDRHDLDAAAPHHPVRLVHRTGHALVLNSLALGLAGIARETADPPGGIIERQVTGSEADIGQPTGLLFEMAHYVEQAVPPPSSSEIQEGMRLARRRLLAAGVTSLQDATASNGLAQWQLLSRLKEAGELPCRVTMMLGHQALSDFPVPRTGDLWLRLGAVKIVLDETTGSLYPPPAELERQVLQAHHAGFQVAIHAIEESSVEAATSALEMARKERAGPDLRHRVEHCSICPPPLLERLARAGALVVTQPAFIYYNGERYAAQVPASQWPWLYRVRSFLEHGLRPAASSDAPVVPLEPLVGIHAAVTRRAATGQALGPQEAVSPLQALAMYTSAAAYSCFQEGEEGSIEVGKLADLVLLDADPTAAPVDAIKEIKVEMTVLGGQVVGAGR